MSITPALVKELRERTGAGMMDCKKALSESAGSMDQAIDWLRKKGLAAAAKKAGRIAAEGLVGVVTNGKTGSVIEVNAETDFVGRNDIFQGFVKKLVNEVAKFDSLEALAKSTYPGSSHTVSDELTQLIAKIGENMSLRRMQVLSVSEGVIAGYVHSAISEGLGKIGVLVALESKADATKLLALGRQIAMHVAAANPQYLQVSDVKQTQLDQERTILTDQAKASGKPQEVIEKMVEGRLRKFYEEIVLLEQIFVMDGESKISKVIEAAAKELGSDIKLKGFVRYALGEGIEKEETDFAAEVKSQLSRG